MKIFLSYASADKEWVEELVSRLRMMGIDPETLDHFPVGGNWEDALREQITSADLVVSVMTDRALQNPWVLFAYGAAKAARKMLLPLRVSGAAEPPSVPRFQTETYRWVESPQDAADQIQRYVFAKLAAA